jgi:DNA-binding transcriptional LysR family regulator
MDLWQLNIFCKVIELKNFSRAGNAVHLSQPTISSHIKDLEEHFDCRLIDRLSKEAIPTKAGELLYRYAKRMLALRDETETALAEYFSYRGHGSYYWKHFKRKFGTWNCWRESRNSKDHSKEINRR